MGLHVSSITTSPVTCKCSTWLRVCQSQLLNIDTTAGCNFMPWGSRTLMNCKHVSWRQAQVQKSAEHYTEAAQDEIDLLAAIAGHAPRSAEGAAACVRMLDHFEHRGPHGRHVCMVFEVRRPAWLLLLPVGKIVLLPTFACWTTSSTAGPTAAMCAWSSRCGGLPGCCALSSPQPARYLMYCKGHAGHLKPRLSGAGFLGRLP